LRRYTIRLPPQLAPPRRVCPKCRSRRSSSASRSGSRFRLSHAGNSTPLRLQRPPSGRTSCPTRRSSPPRKSSVRPSLLTPLYTTGQRWRPSPLPFLLKRPEIPRGQSVGSFFPPPLLIPVNTRGFWALPPSPLPVSRR